MKLAVGERNVATNLGTFSGCVKECCFIIIIIIFFFIIINRRRVEQTWTSRPREVGHTGLQRVVETVDECIVHTVCSYREAERPQSLRPLKGNDNTAQHSLLREEIIII